MKKFFENIINIFSMFQWKKLSNYLLIIILNLIEFLKR